VYDRHRTVDRRWLALTAGAIALVYAAMVPLPGGLAGTAAGPALPQPLGIGLDFWLHAAGYGSLAVLLASFVDARSGRALALVLVAVAVFGGVTELLQVPIAGRTASVGDVAADVVGAWAALACWRLSVDLRPTVDWFGDAEGE